MKFEQIFAISQDKAEEIMKRVGEKYKNDKVFKQELHSNATETLRKEGLELQSGISFKFVKTEEEAKSLPHNVIPISFENNEDSLLLDDLDKVVGAGDMPDGILPLEEVHKLWGKNFEREMQKRIDAGKKGIVLPR